MHPWVQIVKDPKELAAAQVEVVGEAEQHEIQQETGQEAAKVQQEQETTSGNIQEKMGETSEDNPKPTVVTKGGGPLFKRSLSVAGKGKRYDRFIHKNILNHVLYG